MTNCRRSDISEYNDLNTHDQYQLALDAGLSREEALEVCYTQSRDNARTPMQWSSAPQAGFTTGTPWLAVNPNYTEINVAEQERRPDSVLNYYRKLIALRKNDAYRETFTYGEFIPAFADAPGVLAYHRRSKTQDILVCANYGTLPQTLSLPNTAQVLLSNTGREQDALCQLRKEGQLTLSPCESAVILL